MPDILRERYDTISYHSGAVADAHPARLGAIGRLHAVPAAPPDHCRVLELGCGDGMNLLPLAERFPYSQFLGVDLGSAHIAAAEAARTACGIENISFVCADLLAFEPEPETYDYIIGHGVYSWVRDAVKDRLLGICAQALAPGGVAYLSYNTYPVWGLLGGLREFLLTETAREKEPEAQITHARRVIGALHESLAGQPGAYAELLRQSLSDMLGKQPAHLFHDDLAAVNEPCTFTAFTSHARSHGLQYLAEAHYATMIFEHVPAPMRAPLAGLDLDFPRSQQFMDVMFQRWLRNSLLCRSEHPLNRAAEPQVVRECALGLRLRPIESRVNLGPGAPMRMTGPNDLSLEFNLPAEKAMLAMLAQNAPARVPFPVAAAGASRLLQQVRLPSIDSSPEVCGMLFRLFTLDALDMALIGDGDWLRTAEPGAPSPLMRYQACHGLQVANRWHEPVAITPEGRRYFENPAMQSADGAMRAGFLV